MNIKLTEKTIQFLKKVDSDATTFSQALDYIANAYRINPISVDDEENPTSCYHDDIDTEFLLENYDSVEDMVNDFIEQSCDILYEDFQQRWNNDHTEYIRDQYCGNFSVLHEANDDEQVINEYYGKL